MKIVVGLLRLGMHRMLHSTGITDIFGRFQGLAQILASLARIPFTGDSLGAWQQSRMTFLQEISVD